MSFDYSKLKGRIKEVYGTQEAFGRAMGLSHVSISLKLNNKVEWKQKEINRATEILGITDNEIPWYFFTPEV